MLDAALLYGEKAKSESVVLDRLELEEKKYALVPCIGLRTLIPEKSSSG